MQVKNILVAATVAVISLGSLALAQTKPAPAKTAGTPAKITVAPAKVTVAPATTTKHIAKARTAKGHKKAAAKSGAAAQ